MFENLKDLAIIIVVAEIFGLIARKIKLPDVVGQILAGLLIGPCLLGWADNSDYVRMFAEIGVVLLMFSAGLGTNLKTLIKTGPIALLMASFGVLIPLILGTLVAMAFRGRPSLGSTEFYKAVFIGVIMTATSVGITVQTLKELGKLRTELGTTIVSAAIIDDIIGIIVLTVVVGISGGTGVGVGKILLKTLLFFVASGIVGFGLYKIFCLIDKKYPRKKRLNILSVALCFGFSYIAEKFFGIADITGAYVAGVILCNMKDADYVDTNVSMGSYMFFSPIFFAGIGLKTDISNMNWSLLAFSVSFVAVAMAGKILGCGFSAKITKHTWKESLICGIGMMTRGEVALIVAQKGLDVGLITAQEFTPVIMLIIISSVTTPILLKILFKDKSGLSDTKMTEISNKD